MEGMLTFAGGELQGFLSKPDGPERKPGVVIVHDIYGLRDTVKRLARRLSGAGYAVLAPHFVQRLRPTAFDPASELKEALAICRSIPQSQVRSDIDEAIRELGEQEGVDSSRLAVWGYCWGGSLVFPTLADRPDLAAGVVFYGGLPDERTENYPRRPHDCVSAIRKPLLLHYGEEDASIPMEKVLDIEKTMRLAELHFELYTYPGAGHAFCDETRDNYRETSAELAMERSLDFLQRHVGAPRP